MATLEQLLIAAQNADGKAQRGKKFLRKRSGTELTREQVKAIKKGRKLLRKEMKAKGLKEKSDFELTATSMGLYFDKPRALLWLQWFFHGAGLLKTLVAASVMLLLALFGYATVSQLQGHFTINMSNGMFQEGFVLSETKDFANASSHLFAVPAEAVPCISIAHLPTSLDEIDGPHNATYFAYTFYCRNEGESTVGYKWQIDLNSESRQLSSAIWVMIFEDGEMLFYADRNTVTGEEEALPARDDNSQGYIGSPLGEFSKDPETQYEVIQEGRGYDYTRVIPIPFVTERVVAMGEQESTIPGEVHKYTVVIWLEGDDPDCTDELIGGHVGMDFHFQLVDEEDGAANSGDKLFGHWETLWDNLKFWK